MKNIDYVSPEIAKGLKEIGFAEPCDANYQISLKSKKHKEDGYSGPFGWKKGEIVFDRSYFRNFWKEADYSGSHWLMVAAPLYQHAIRWFMQTHRLYGKIDQYYGERFYVNIECFDNFGVMYTKDELRDLGEYKTYEEAQEACILKMIEVIKNKQII